MSDLNYLSLDVIVKTIHLDKISGNADENDPQVDFLQINFGGITFDIDGIHLNENDAPQGRSIVFETYTTLEELCRKFSNNVIQIKLYMGEETTARQFQGEASYSWSDIHLSEVDPEIWQQHSFFKKCEITKKGKTVGNLEIAIRLNEKNNERRLEKRISTHKNAEWTCERQCTNSAVSLKASSTQLNAESNTESPLDPAKQKISEEVLRHLYNGGDDSDSLISSIWTATTNASRDILSAPSEEEQVQRKERKKVRKAPTFSKQARKGSTEVSQSKMNSIKFESSRSVQNQSKNRSKEVNMSKAGNTTNIENPTLSTQKLSKVLVWLKKNYSTLAKNKLDTKAKKTKIGHTKSMQNQSKNSKKPTNFIRKNAQPVQSSKQSSAPTLKESKRKFKKILRKSRRRYHYVKHRRSIPAFERHQHCLKRPTFVPAKMGWRWDIEDPEVAKGWRPGYVRTSIDTQLKTIMPNRQPIANSTTSILKTDANKHENFVDVKIKRKQLENYLKDIGFSQCDCGQTVDRCTCRSYMENRMLERVVESLGKLLGQRNLKNLLTLDLNENESETQNQRIRTDSGFRPKAQVISFQNGNFKKNERTADIIQMGKTCSSGIRVTIEPRKSKEIQEKKDSTDNEQTRIKRGGNDDFPSKFSKYKNTVYVHQGSPDQSPRVTKPISRWQRIQQKRQASRPPWDDSIYVPPPLDPNVDKGALKAPQNSHLPQKRCNDECKTASFSIDAVAERRVTPAKPTYNRNCSNAVKVLVQQTN